MDGKNNILKSILIDVFEKSENLCTTEDFLEEISLDIFNLMKS